MRTFQLLMLGCCTSLLGLISCQPSSTPEGMIRLEGGRVGAFEVDGFFIDQHPVTVGQFRTFVEATGYQTEAERFGDGAIFVFETGEWMLKKGANWKMPNASDGGPAPDNHPVTLVSWNDAQAYCKWAGKRLPSNREWEYAARNANNTSTVYPWGNDLKPGGAYKANFWQGAFPQHNFGEDGFMTTSPVGHFGSSPLGLQDIVGNVWEWVEEWSPIERSGTGPERMMRGGSFLCDLDVCHGFQIIGESSSTPETGSFHIGFRCVKDLP